MSRIKQPDISVEVLPGLAIPEELLKVYSGGFKLDLNARVDKVGKDHMNGHIYRVIIGDQQPLYLSDARLDFGNPVVTAALSMHDHKHSSACNHNRVTTSPETAELNVTLDGVDSVHVGGVIPLDNIEPPIHGKVAGGLSAEWMDWYRCQGKGCSLIEARDAGLLRLAQIKKERSHDGKSD